MLVALLSGASELIRFGQAAPSGPEEMAGSSAQKLLGGLEWRQLSVEAGWCPGHCALAVVVAAGDLTKLRPQLQVAPLVELTGR